MNPRNTILLVLLAVIVFGFLYYIEPMLRKPPPVAMRVLPGFKAAEVSSVRIQPRDGVDIRVERSNGVWRMTAPISYPVLATNIDNLLLALETLSPETRISGQELKEHKASGEYGFDPPAFVIILQQGEDQRQLRIGNLTVPGDQAFAQTIGMDAVDVISAEFVKLIPARADMWRDTEFFNLNKLAFDQLVVTNKGRFFKLQRPAPNKSWKLAEPKARADDPKVRSLLNELQSLRVTHFETDDTNAYLERYGLQPPELELRFIQGSNQVFSLQTGKSPATNADLVYARRNDQSTIVLLPAKPLAGWRADQSEFRDRHLIRIAPAAHDVLEIEIRPPGGEICMVSWTNGIWIAASPSLGFQADNKIMNGWLKNLDALKVVQQPDGSLPVRGVVLDVELANYGLATNTLKYLFKREGETNREELDFGFKDGSIYARRGDLAPEETSVYLVQAEDVGRFPTNILQLRERHIWKFDATNVTNLTIRANGRVTAYAHTGERRWVPQNGMIKDELQKLQMQEELENLSTLEALNWVEADPKDRDRYGFTTNSVQVTLAINRRYEELTYSFELGGTSPQGVYVASKLDGREWVFEISAREAADILRLFYIEERK